MHNDVVAMYDALRARRWEPEEIMILEGILNRELVLTCLQTARAALLDGNDGGMFLHYSGHGAYWPWDAVDPAQTRPALLLDPDSYDAPDRWVFWDEVFAALVGSSSARLLVLPDC